MRKRDEGARDELATPEHAVDFRGRPFTDHPYDHVISTNARARPAKGEINEGFNTLFQSPDH